MNIKEVEKLILLVSDFGISEIKVKTGENYVYIKNKDDYIPHSQKTLSSEEIKNHSDENIMLFQSPMVGTFYRSPHPSTPPFVEKGQIVKKGEILCIIEAMKIMNHIESEYSGVISEILVEDSNPVEFNQPLFRILSIDKKKR